MALNKKDEFSKVENELADFANAISHPARVAILKEIAKRQTCICGEIVEVLPLAQSTVSQHLKELKQMGLIQGTIEGTSICYCIDPKVWDKYKKLFSEFFVEVKPVSKSACGTDCC